MAKITKLARIKEDDLQFFEGLFNVPKDVPTHSKMFTKVRSEVIKAQSYRELEVKVGKLGEKMYGKTFWKKLFK